MAIERLYTLILASFLFLFGCRATEPLSDPEFTHINQAIRQANYTLDS